MSAPYELVKAAWLNPQPKKRGRPLGRLDSRPRKRRRETRKDRARRPDLTGTRSEYTYAMRPIVHGIITGLGLEVEPRTVGVVREWLNKARRRRPGK